MEKGVLSSYLDAGLFRIGDDDSRLQLFEKAAEDLAEGFRKSPSAVIPAILVGVDPGGPRTRSDVGEGRTRGEDALEHLQ